VQREIEREMELLDAKGRIVEEGWARKPLWRYRRASIAGSALRIKEWDYYYLFFDGGRRGLTFTLSDLGFAGMFAIGWFEFDRGFYRQKDETTLLPLGGTGFPEDPASGSVFYEGKGISIWVSSGEGLRRVRAEAPGLEGSEGKSGLSADISFAAPETEDSMNIATSWKERRTAFYYNRKINCMRASGTVRLGGKAWKLDPARDSGGLDWGRGLWTYKNRWYWSSASGFLPEGAFGWNLGYGFSDRSSATENAIFLNGHAHKLGEVEFHYDPSDYLKQWRITSDDGRFEAAFEPLLDRKSDTNLLLIRSAQHQVFGKFTGRAMLDDGTPIKFKNFPGFAEDVYNRW